MVAIPGAEDQMACQAATGEVAGVALDVTVPEPLAAGEPLLDVPHVFGKGTIEMWVLVVGFAVTSLFESLPALARQLHRYSTSAQTLTNPFGQFEGGLVPEG